MTRCGIVEGTGVVVGFRVLVGIFVVPTKANKLLAVDERDDSFESVSIVSSSFDRFIFLRASPFRQLHFFRRLRRDPRFAGSSTIFSRATVVRFANDLRSVLWSIPTGCGIASAVYLDLGKRGRNTESDGLDNGSCGMLLGKCTWKVSMSPRGRYVGRDVKSSDRCPDASCTLP